VGPPSRCPAQSSTADILKAQREQQARLDALNGDGDAPDEGDDKDEARTGSE
jgi:hypothetical protein